MRRMRLALTLGLSVAACSPGPGPSSQAALTPTSTAAPSTAAGLTGQAQVLAGPHAGVYQLAANPADMVCVVADGRWSVGFSSPEVKPGVTTLVLTGSSRDAGGPVADFEMTIGATTHENTLVVRPGQYLGAGTTTLRLDGSTVGAEMEGTTADGVGVSVTVSCPLQPGP